MQCVQMSGFVLNGTKSSAFIALLPFLVASVTKHENTVRKYGDTVTRAGTLSQGLGTLSQGLGTLSHGLSHNQ